MGDNGYAVLDLLHCCQSLREPVTLIARLRLDAALYAPAPARQPGRPPLKGARRPSLKVLLDQPQVTWASVAVAWSDGATRTVELTSQTAVWNGLSCAGNWKLLSRRCVPTWVPLRQASRPQQQAYARRPGRANPTNSHAATGV